MKRIFAIILLVAMLSGCSASETVTKPNEMPNQQPEATAPTVTLQNPGVPGLSCENGKYFLTLPQSGKTLELSDEEARFVPYITDTLVAEAERKILEQTAQYGENSGFYLQITDGYLCLAMEIIKDLTPPEPTGTEAGNILSGCGIDHDHIFYSERISTQPVKEETELRFLQYTWDGWGISIKTVGNCDVGTRIRDALSVMPETGETAPKISDDTLQLGGGQYPVDRGTMWIEWENRIWRLTLEPAQLCLVETHLGEGRILQMPEGFLKDVNDAWRYAPYDYYRGTYRNGEKTVNLENVYQASTTVAMCVKDIHVESSHDPHNTITLELTSTVDQTVELKLRCQQSDDNLTRGDDEILELKKDVPQTVELEFGGWKDARYWICMEAANTKAEIIIEP